jgi:hypothetical protein
VLSLPPAFVLSQDQTLKLDMRFNLADHYKLTEPASNPSQGQGGSSKRSTDLSLSVTTQQRVIRKDNVVHVSLSSYAHVKQHAKLSPRKKKTNSPAPRQTSRRKPQLIAGKSRSEAARQTGGNPVVHGRHIPPPTFPCQLSPKTFFDTHMTPDKKKDPSENHALILGLGAANPPQIYVLSRVENAH